MQQRMFFFQKDQLVPWKLVNMGEMSWKSNNFQINRECLLWVNWWNLVEGSDLWSNVSQFCAWVISVNQRDETRCWPHTVLPKSGILVKWWTLRGHRMATRCWRRVGGGTEQRLIAFLTRMRLRNWGTGVYLWQDFSELELSKIGMWLCEIHGFFPQDTNIPPDGCPR